MDNIRVILIDSETATRRRTSALLAAAEDIEVVGLARSMPEGLKLATAVEPAVVVLTSNFDQFASLDLIRRLTADWPATATIVVSRSSDALFLQDAVLAGAKGWLPQPVPADRLLAAVRSNARQP